MQGKLELEERQWCCWNRSGCWIKSRLGEYIGHLEAGRMKDVEYAMAVSLGLFDDSGIEEEFGREQVEYEQFLHM